MFIRSEQKWIPLYNQNKEDLSNYDSKFIGDEKE